MLEELRNICEGFHRITELQYDIYENHVMITNRLRDCLISHYKANNDMEHAAGVMLLKADSLIMIGEEPYAVRVCDEALSMDISDNSKYPFICMKENNKEFDNEDCLR